MKKSSWPLKIWAAAAAFLLYLPLLAVVASSFNSAASGSAWQGFTLKWHRQLWHDPLILQALRNTLILGAASTALSTILGVGFGLSLSRTRGWVRELFSGVSVVNVVIPDIIMAAALLIFFSLAHEMTGHLELGIGTMILSHVTFQIPFVAWIIRSGLAGLDPALEEAARDLGAPPRRVFWKVTLPLLRPAVVGGALLAFTLSLDDFVISFFTSGPGSTTLPIYIYSSVKRGLSPEIHALSAWIIGCSAGAALLLGQARKRLNLV